MGLPSVIIAGDEVVFELPHLLRDHMLGTVAARIVIDGEEGSTPEGTPADTLAHEGPFDFAVVWFHRLEGDEDAIVEGALDMLVAAAKERTRTIWIGPLDEENAAWRRISKLPAVTFVPASRILGPGDVFVSTESRAWRPEPIERAAYTIATIIGDMRGQDGPGWTAAVGSAALAASVAAGAWMGGR